MKSLRGLNLSFSILGLANKGLNEAKYKIFGCATVPPKPAPKVLGVTSGRGYQEPRIMDF